MAWQRSKSQEVKAATWKVNSMLHRSGEVVEALHRRKIDFCSAQETRWEVRRCLVLLVEDTSSFGKAVIKGLLVLVCLLLKDGLTVSKWSESMCAAGDWKADCKYCFHLCSTSGYKVGTEDNEFFFYYKEDL